jgi:hypothetical protein
VAVYVDDIAMAMENSQELTKILMEMYKFKLNGTEPITYHLGMDFYHDMGDILCIAPCKYLQQVMANYKCCFGAMPKQVSSPLVKGDIS